MADVTEAFLPVGDSRLFIRAAGEGPVVVVLHGGPDFDHEYLLPELGDLPGHRVVLYDQRGRGRSWSGEGPDQVTLSSEMDDLDAIVGRTSVQRVALLGHSFGGLLAAEYATRRPDRLSQLILLHSGPVSRAGRAALTAEITARTTPETASRMATIVADPAYLAGDIALEAERYRLHFARTIRDRRVLDEVVGRLRRAFTPAGIVAARAIENRLYQETWERPDYDLLPALRRLRIPALVVHATEDFVPGWIATELAEAIPGARLATVEASHFSFVERPAEVRSIIGSFLAGGTP